MAPAVPPAAAGGRLLSKRRAYFAAATSSEMGRPSFIAAPAMLLCSDTSASAQAPGRSRFSVTKRPLPQRSESLRAGMGRAGGQLGSPSF